MAPMLRINQLIRISLVGCCVAWNSVFAESEGPVGANLRGGRGSNDTPEARSLSQRPDYEKCGVPGGEGRHLRIVHGEDSSKCVWRWQVSLRSVRNGTASHFCGGTLIDPKWVLTAAHCVAGMSECGMNRLRIVAGDLDKDSNSEHDEVERTVARVISHPRYNVDSQSDMDYALIELAEPMPLGKCIGVACLPSSSDEQPPGQTCSITGWGTLESGGSTPHILQEALVTTVSNEECDEAYENSTITDAMLCASGVSAAGLITDACQGDSGGPLVCEESGSYVIRGATSWGDGCAQKEFPGVYSRVSYALDWIRGVMAGNTSVTGSPEEEVSEPDFDDAMWVVTSGPCTMDNSSCISSPNFPSNYSNFQGCKIAINASAAVPIDVEYFSTEEYYDELIVDCQPYSGKRGPQGVTPTSEITWSADRSVTGSGWKLCPSEA